MKLREILLGAGAISPLLNVGSSTAVFRTMTKPHIEAELFAPLRARGTEVRHLDLKAAEGVDIIGDILDPELRAALAGEGFRCLLIANVLEHVRDRAGVAAACEEIVGPGGLVLATVPESFPYHADPIDTRYRPTPAALAALFTRSAPLLAETLTGRSYGETIRASGSTPAREAARTALATPDRAGAAALLPGARPSLAMASATLSGLDRAARGALTHGRGGSPVSRTLLRGARATAAGFVIRFGARIALPLRRRAAVRHRLVRRLCARRRRGRARGHDRRARLQAPAVQAAGRGGAGRPAPHILLDARLLVAWPASSLGACSSPPCSPRRPACSRETNVGFALLFLAPMIAGQALLDTLSAATRWTHKIRYEVLSRSMIEPYGGARRGARRLGARLWRGGALICYWAGTLAALAYAALGARRCLGPFRLGAWRPQAAASAAAPRQRRGDAQRHDERPLRPGRSLSGRPPARRGAGRHLRHGAADPRPRSARSARASTAC